MALRKRGLRMIMCSRQRTMITTKAVMDSLLERAADVESLAALSRFRASG